MAGAGGGQGGGVALPCTDMGGRLPRQRPGQSFCSHERGCFPGPTFGRGYGPLGSPGRGRVGQEARSQEVGEVLLSEEGQGDNTAYTGRLGR